MKKHLPHCNRCLLRLDGCNGVFGSLIKTLSWEQAQEIASPYPVSMLFRDEAQMLKHSQLIDADILVVEQEGYDIPIINRHQSIR